MRTEFAATGDGRTAITAYDGDAKRGSCVVDADWLVIDLEEGQTWNTEKFVKALASVMYVEVAGDVN